MANEVNDRVDNIEDELNFEPELGEDEDFGAEVTQEAGFADDEPKSLTNAKSNLPSTNSSSGLNFDFSELGDIPGVVVGDIGLEVSRLPVEKVKFTKDSRSMISILSNRVVAIKAHYTEELGSFLCFGGSCCNLGLPRVKYLFPCLVYETNKKGVPISNKVDYRCLALGKDAYNDILTMQELNGDITGIDIIVTCNDEQYQKVSFQPAGPARWRKSKRIVKETQDFWKDHMKDLIAPVARKITEAELKKASAGDITPPQGEVNFDDVFGED